MRLRFLRIFVPALLVPFLVLIALTLRQRPPALSRGPTTALPFPGPRLEGFEVTEIWTGNRRLFLRAGLGELDSEGRLRLERVERVEVDRERSSPLVVRADRGRVEGKPGQRLLTLEGGVEVQEGSAGGLHLSLSGLEVDEGAGQARSLGAVRFRGPGYRGTAEAITYGLHEDQPTVLVSPEVDGEDGSHLTAKKASLLDREREMELEGEVRMTQGTTRFQSDNAHLLRDEDGRLRVAVATGGVSCQGFPFGGIASDLSAERLRIEWEAAGEASRGLLEGHPTLRRGTQLLEAGTIELVRGDGDTSGWNLAARGSVRAQGPFEGSPGSLTAGELTAVLDPNGRLMRAEAQQAVRLEGRDALAEAARASFVPSAEGGGVTLFSTPGQRARIARNRTRVSAQRISTDPHGSRFVAEDRVEATLLPEPLARGQQAPRVALFASGAAIHFVATRLEGEASGGKLLFRGAVRGWQVERNLSAEQVEIDQEQNVLKANTSVTSRFPRQRSGALSESDFLQISADALDYSGATGIALYEGNAKVQLAEGWIQGSRLQVDLDEGGNGPREVQISGSVRFEMRAPRGAEGLVTGKGDRMVYTPREQTVRIFGDQAPASVTQGGEKGGTTTGRMLRYRLDAGTLEVESEDRERGRDRTPGG